MDRLRVFGVACVLGVLAGCHGQDAVLLTVTADAPVEQYQLFVHDDDTQTIAYSSGFGSVSTPGQPPLDLTKNKLKLALKLSRPGHFTLLLVGVIGEISDGKPSASAKVLFWSEKVHVDGPADVNARLLTVPAGDDADGDYFPDAGPFMQHVAEAATLYAGKTNVLDCDDKVDMPMASDGKAIALTADKINPFATEICGDGYDENCDGNIDEACVDKDGDHDVRGHDCDDNDAKRHHPTDIDPFPDPPNCCGYSLGKINTSDENTDFLHASGDAHCYAASCNHDAVLCPMKRCGDGIDESCRGLTNDPKNDTSCIVDEDCDGYPAPPQGNDCDDHDPNVHPGAVETCTATKDLNCNGTVGEGCVPCDLDGDGFERTDSNPNNPCPDNKDKHPGILDCNDDDAGVFPGATSVAGGTEGGVSVGKVAAALRGFCRTIYERTGASGTPKINPFGGLVGDADCNGKAYEGCPAQIDPGCDKDGDGWPGVAMSNGKNCNPDNVTLDCDDNDPTTFPSAPLDCKKTTGTYKSNCTPQGPADCSGDSDGDGYSAPADCDDHNAAVHPFAVELCDGIDNNCDGLVDESNPDPSGKPLVTTGAITQCTDSNTGECAKTKGSCVCSIALPVVDPLIGQLMQPRTMCPGEGGAGKATGCFGAGQPKPQSCDSSNPKDDDCDGRVDAPDGARLAVKGMTCGINVGQCKAGIVVACDKSQTNCFTAPFARAPANTSWYVCSTAAPNPVAVCPTAEVCNGLDDDCDGHIPGDTSPIPIGPTDEADHDQDKYLACGPCVGAVAPGKLGCGDCNDLNPNIHPGAPEICNGVDDACVGAGFVDGKDDCGKGANATKPTCCGGNGCRDTTTDYQFCGSCTNNCSVVAATTTNDCVGGACECGALAACTGGLTCQGTAPAGMCVAGLGSTCTLDNQCASGHCTDLHCCSVASCGTCKACTGAAGTCVNQPSNMQGNGCMTAGMVCDGSGNCKKATGQSCTTASDCWNGLCVDGFCCNSACNAQCNRCDAPTPGTCAVTTGAVVNNNMPMRTACVGAAPCTGSCDGTNLVCQYPGGATACGAQTCAPGAGGAVVTPVGSCNMAGGCTQVGNPPCIYTQCNGTMCASSCTMDTDCVAGDYCSTTMGGTCQTRHPAGTTCITNDCQMAGCRFCDAADPCRASGQCCPTACAGPSCSNATHMQTTRTCATGSCQATMTACAGYVCDVGTNLCKTTCTADADCQSTFYCDSTGHCVAETLMSNQNCAVSACYMMTNCRQCLTDMPCNIPGNGKCP